MEGHPRRRQRVAGKESERPARSQVELLLSLTFVHRLVLRSRSGKQGNIHWAHLVPPAHTFQDGLLQRGKTSKIRKQT